MTSSMRLVVSGWLVARQYVTRPAEPTSGDPKGVALIAAEQGDLLWHRATPHCTASLTPGPASRAPRFTPHHPRRLGLSM